MQNAAVALIFYAIAMIINLVMMETEDAFRMTLFNETLCDNRNMVSFSPNQKTKPINFVDFLSRRPSSAMTTIDGNN